jgi:glycosyltransferase involved in cell wall biosynthesis
MYPISITMLITSLDLTGTPRMMMDIIENINFRKFPVSVAYKPEYPRSELDLLKDLDSLGVKLIPLRGKRLFDPRGIFDLYRHLRQDSVRIVHCWDALGIAARILSLFSKFRIIQSYCNTLVSRGSFSYYLFNKITSLLIDGIIFCSIGVQESYEKGKTIFLGRKKIALIHNCVDIGRIQKRSYDLKKIRKEWNISETEIILTNIAYFNEQKGQKYLLDSIKIIVKQMPNIKLILVGWGPLEANLRTQASELEIESNVIFAGKCQRNTVFEILSITDVFVLSSLWEGFGMVLAEAMAMEKPVVTTNTDGSQVLVEHNINGLVVQPRNPHLFSDALMNLIISPERRRKMGELGKKKISNFFSVDMYIQKHEDFYKKVIQAS